MKITITTTEKKLTKSIINQIPLAGYDSEALSQCTVLGHFNGIVKYARKCALIKNNLCYPTDSYLLLPLDYELRNPNKRDVWGVIRTFGKWRFGHDFKSEDDYGDWMDAYTRVRDEALAKQIFV